MPTADTLRKATILQVDGAVIRVAHPDISNQTRTYLSAPIAVGGTAMSVRDNNNFDDDDWLLIGEVGDSETETVDVNQATVAGTGAITRGTAVTVTNSLTFAHELDAPVTLIRERGIKIYRAATDGGAGTIIESVDARTATGRQLADAVMIQWDKPYTEFTLITTDTAGAFYYAVFTDGTTDGAASDYVASTGYTASAVETFIQQSLNITNTKINNLITRPFLITCANDCQNAITQFNYQDPRTGEYMPMDWDFEVTVNSTTLAITQNENRYSLASLGLKTSNSDRVFINVRVGDRKQCDKVTIDKLDDYLELTRRTDVATLAVIGGTTLVVDSNVIFTTSGSLTVGVDTLTYTGKTGTTTFTGIPAAGSGSITVAHPVDTAVWQNISPGEPRRYAIFEDNLYFDRPPSSDFASYPINIRFYKALTALTEASDTTEVTFTNVFQYYMASRIEERKGNLEKAAVYMKKFDDMVLQNALKSKIPTTDTQSYHSYEDPLDTMNIDRWSSDESSL